MEHFAHSKDKYCFMKLFFFMCLHKVCFLAWVMFKDFERMSVLITPYVLLNGREELLPRFKAYVV